MCCGGADWKRIVVFGLTFGLGVLAAGLFISGKVPQVIKPNVIPAADNKNCVPVDESLRYEKLPLKETQTPVVEPLLPPESDSNIVCEKKDPYNCYYVIKENSNKSDEKPKEKKKSLKDESENQNGSAEQQYYDSSKNPAEFRNLLHKERCFETQAQ